MLSLPFNRSLIILLSGFLVYVIRLSTKRNKVTNHAKLFATIKSILHPPNAAVRQLLEERAWANQRLVHALGLSNTFVSADEGVHKDFVVRAHRLLSGAQRRGWPRFHAVARDAVQWQLNGAAEGLHSVPGEYSGEYSYSTAIQTITLYVVLVALLGIEDVPAYADVRTAAAEITALWAQSKGGAVVPPARVAVLHECLRRLAPDAEAFPAPVDFIVPAWETLWRVVAETVAHTRDAPDIEAIFEALNKHQEDGTAARRVVAEAMRLNPPSRRIGRAAACAWVPACLAHWAPRRLVKADVSELLQSTDLWGEDCRDFSPARHGSLLPAQKEAMACAFGQGPLRCIASSWAPMAAAMIVAAILEEYTVLSGEDIGGREGWSGWALRRKMDRGGPDALAQ
ncbi:hypothetical protein HYPSUDRAFT_44560 [Hypholoma sublateritium FD-334 SS-4]|uniref:Cytochrome P450 n=1 Tax=Hypholoma sublateritium (strain FD-334 SS-4) TaxID=945553 RepID=A0A0D2NQQ0_HYPSF|nr:hypothetical protein HYPSUDRAFT_44560 [Hypholoma sublateritium FD-334 SS-4]